MYVKHVHSTAVAVYSGHWYYKPKTESTSEWLSNMNRICYNHLNDPKCDRPLIIIERVAGNTYAHIIRNIDDWVVMELPSEYLFELLPLKQINEGNYC